MTVPVLPRIRADLQLLRGPRGIDGALTWNIYDSARHRHYRIGWLAFEIISRWHSRDPAAVADRVNRETTLSADESDVAAVAQFLHTNSLTETPPNGESDDYLSQYQATRTSWLNWLVHNYLFFRVPLFHPDAFLRLTAPIAAPFFSRTFAKLIMVLALIGLFLASRQWDAFVSTFSDFFNLQGLLWFGVTLFLTKTLHELGHAYAAQKYGCRVASMGVAFLVMFPVLYTDTTDAWRLTSRRQRVHVAAAGVVAEIYLATAATLLWTILPDGGLRSAMFFLATSSWIVTITVNLNPLMRFDGYYLLSDYLGIDNLQDRAFAMGRWRLRELLFGANDLPPEALSTDITRLLYGFAWAVWIFRFFLFLGIAILVYTMFFKALGVVLFAIEILWFIVMPIWKEIYSWWRSRARLFTTRRALVTGVLLSAVVALFVTPWGDRVHFPAIMEMPERVTVYAKEPGLLDKIFIQPGQWVSAGDPLVRIRSLELEYETRRALATRQALQERLNRQAASRSERARLLILQKESIENESYLLGLDMRKEALTLRAPIAGRVMDVAESLMVGRPINEEAWLLSIGDNRHRRIKGYVEEVDVGLIEAGAEASFFPNDVTLPAVAAHIVEIEGADAQDFDEPYMASVYGGGIAVRRTDSGALSPEASVYRVRLTPSSSPPVDQVIVGYVHARGKPKSLFDRLYVGAAAVLLRESNF